MHKSDTHASGGARGTFCHNSGRRGKCGWASIGSGGFPKMKITHRPSDADRGE